MSITKNEQRNILRKLCESEEGKEELRNSIGYCIEKSIYSAEDIKASYKRILGGYMPGWMHKFFDEAIEEQTSTTKENIQKMINQMTGQYPEGGA